MVNFFQKKFSKFMNAIYFLRAYQRVFLGPLNEKYKSLKDMGRKDLMIIMPLALLTLLFGVYPQPLIDMISSAMNEIYMIIQLGVQ